MASPLRRLPEAVVALVFSALELREHCALRHCGRIFDVVARRSSASPQLLRLLAVPSSLPPPPPTEVTSAKSGAPRPKKTRPAKGRRRPPPVELLRRPDRQVALAQWTTKREAAERARSPWNGRTRVNSPATVQAIRGLRPRRLDLEMQNLDGDLWLTLAIPSPPPTTTADGCDLDAKSKAEPWTVELRHLKIGGWNCIVPFPVAALRFAPRLETLDSAAWTNSAQSAFRHPSTSSQSSSALSVSVAVPRALVRLKVGAMCVEECQALPPTLTDLDIEWPTVAVRNDNGPSHANIWVAAIVARFPRLVRLRFGRLVRSNEYWLATLTESLPHLTDLDVPACALPAAPLVHSRLQRLACKFFVSDATAATSGSNPAWFGSTHGAATAPRPSLLGPALHTLDLATTMASFAAPRFEHMLAVLASAAPSLTRLAGMYVVGDTEFARATDALASAGVRLCELRLRTASVTTMRPLGRFADSLRVLEVSDYHQVARLLAAVEPKDCSGAAMG
jgi:hypothetical protein